MALRAKVLTVSDGVIAGTRDDASGRDLVARLEEAGFEIADRRVVEDGVTSVSAALVEMTAGFAGLVLTTGGTGFGPRDLTPEGTRLVVDREAPGLAEAMRHVTLGTNPHGMLSRGICGAVGRALICNLPGSPRGSVESLEAILEALPHALVLLAGGRPH